MDVRSFFGRRRPAARRPRRAPVRSRVAVSKSVPKRAKKAMTRIANSVFSRRTETKYVSQFISTEPVDIYGATTPANGLPQLYDCLPGVSIGDDEFERNGVKIQPTKHVVDLDLRFNESKLSAIPAIKMASAAWDIQVHVWYGYARRFRAVSEVLANAPTILSQQLEDGQGNVLPWTGTPYDDMYRINGETLVLKHKTFRMYRPSGSQNTADSTQQTYFPQVIRKRLSLSFKPPKTLLFNDNVDIPDNYAPFLIIGYCHNDGTNASAAQYVPQTPLVSNTPALQMQMRSHLWFKDA